MRVKRDAAGEGRATSARAFLGWVADQSGGAEPCLDGVRSHRGEEDRARRSGARNVRKGDGYMGCGEVSLASVPAGMAALLRAGAVALERTPPEPSGWRGPALNNYHCPGWPWVFHAGVPFRGHSNIPNRQMSASEGVG